MRSGRDADGHTAPESIDHAAAQRQEQQLGALADKDGRLPFVASIALFTGPYGTVGDCFSRPTYVCSLCSLGSWALSKVRTVRQ